VFELVEFLTNVFLFKNINRETLVNITKEISPEIKKYSHKEIIYTPNEYEKKLGFVINGECAVARIKNDDGAVPLNTIKPGYSFGIMAVLSNEEEFPTRITAIKSSEILFISQRDVLSLIKKHPEVAMNVINFLANKVSFLNHKIATFSSTTVEEKLSNYLAIEYKKHGNCFPFNCKKSAEAISSGRASIYRAIASMTEAGVIKLENKKIYILDPKGLERNTK